MKNLLTFIKNCFIFSKNILFLPIFIIIFSITLHFPHESLEKNRNNNNVEEAPFSEKIVVTARLPEEERDPEKIPASITIITSEEIEKSGAKNIQELLSGKEGIIFYDDVGNGIETTIDIRGFNEGTAAAFLLDGVRINEPDDNRVNLEQISLSSIERIEIYRGSSSSTFGAGALSGTVNIVTKNLSEEKYLHLRASYGSDDTDKEALTTGFKVKNTGIIFDLSREASDGFRENGKYDLSHIFIKAGGSYGLLNSLSFAFLHNEASLGAPGALTLDELNQDRYSSPFNKVDRSDEKLNQFTMRIHEAFENRDCISANFFFRENSIDTLTTGRWLSGFETESDVKSFGMISQYLFNSSNGSREFTLATGIEVQFGSFSSIGFFTDSAGNRFSASPDSSNETDDSRGALFAQATMDISQMVSFLGGVRYDSAELDYKDLLRIDVEGSTRFSELSFKGGVNIYPSDSTTLYLLYSEAFLPPTVYELFAFPLFGSNPNLEPTLGKNYEVGIRKKWGSKARIHASLFRIDAKDEVVFLITDPISFIGKNENVGKSQRKGLEISTEINFSEVISAFLNYTFIDARLRSGENSGNDIPLVPGDKLSAGLAARIGKDRSLFLSVTAMHVGKQYLIGDDSNQLHPLDSFTTLNARISKNWKSLNVFIEAKNLLDEEYSTRGITNGYDLFYTPAPGRRIFAGMEYRMAF
jgi:iron complex outermembrane receptor protein